MKLLGEKIQAFVDGTQLYLFIPPESGEAQSLAAVMGWMRTNKLELNSDKMGGGSYAQEQGKQPVLEGFTLTDMEQAVLLDSKSRLDVQEGKVCTCPARAATLPP